MTLVGSDQLLLRFPVDPQILAAVRALPSRRFDPDRGGWVVPHNQETWRALELLGADLASLTMPTTSGYSVGVYRSWLEVRTPFSPRNTALCRLIPDHRMWSKEVGAWLCKITPRNLAYLKEAFAEATWSAEAVAKHTQLVVRPQADAERFRSAKQEHLEQDAVVTDYKFGGPEPFAHQRRAFLLSRSRKAFALLMEQGTGKSKVIVDTACWLFGQGKITQVAVVAPNSVKTNWVTEEIPLHTPAYVRYRTTYWSAGAGAEQRRQQDSVLEGEEPDVLRWFIVNVEALSTDRGTRVLERFLARGPTLLVVDESSRIKTPGAQRTRTLLKLGRRAAYRRICTGTPITQGPLDAYTQFTFLDPTILGFSSFYSFRNHFAILGGFNNKQVVGYTRLEELLQLIEPHSYRVLRESCLDLPPKIYQKLEVDLAPEQARLYHEMRTQMLAELDGQTRITAPIVLTQLLRLQQIAGGFVPGQRVLVAENGVPVEEPLPARPISGPNPKLLALLELVEQISGKVIVWSRFRAELALVADTLREEHGVGSVVEFHGGVSDEDRILARTQFQDPGSGVRFFVGQTETGGMGLTLTQARTVVYFSNSFSLEARLQSEDRAHRIGQTGSVTYVDLVARGTIDLKTLSALRGKKDLASATVGDAWRAWV